MTDYNRKPRIKFLAFLMLLQRKLSLRNKYENMSEFTTLSEFIQDQQKKHRNATGEFSAVLRDISIASKMVNRVLNRAGLLDIVGGHEQANASGDQQQKLDVYANDWFKKILSNCEECCGFASEEESEIVAYHNNTNNSKYIVIFDPLDGSSNIDVNISVGTIFSIFQRKSDVKDLSSLDDFLQKGSEQVASGYVLYGTSTMLVYTTGEGVNGFTLYPSIGEYCLSHPNMRIPDYGPGYSINQGYTHKIPDHINRFVSNRMMRNDSLRFVGSMVADVHRILMRGGVFIYPSLKDSHPKGKLRLLYECNPMAFIIEQAGGLARDESGIPILELCAESLHERTSIIIGSKDNVLEVLES